MYIDIQKQINKLMIILFLSVIIILTIGYCYITSYHLSQSYLFLFFFLILIFNYTFIRFIEKNLEHYRIYKMLQKGQITLAYIKCGRFYKESRDSRFQKQFIYELEIEIITQDHKIIKRKIYECLLDSDLSSLPGHVYVTYSQKGSMIGIVPTFLLNMTPSVEPIVRMYEDTYNVKYLAVMRKQGLALKNMAELVSYYSTYHKS